MNENLSNSRTMTRTSAMTTLVALLVVASSTAPAAARTGHVETRATRSETPVVRVVAAMVEAMARDLLHNDRSVDSALLGRFRRTATVAATTVVTTPGRCPAPPVPVLDERLLDLPPPLH